MRRAGGFLRISGEIQIILERRFTIDGDTMTLKPPVLPLQGAMVGILKALWRDLFWLVNLGYLQGGSRGVLEG